MHILLNLLDTAEFNTCNRLCRQSMQHMSTTLLATVTRHSASLPINNKFGSLQPVNTQNNVMVQLWKNTAFHNTMQCLETCRANNQRYQASLQRQYLTSVS